MSRPVSPVSIEPLGDPGDLSAPPGSRPWATAVRIELQATLANMKGDAHHLARMSQAMRQHEGYTQLRDRDGRPFATYGAFCRTAPPYGLGYTPRAAVMLLRALYTPEELLAIIADVRTGLDAEEVRS